METTGRDSELRPQDSDEGGNVLRFPRGWFGPIEDLIPVGPRAHAADVVDLEPPAPATAEDFWGEGSAALQHAVQPAAPLDVQPPVIDREMPQPPPLSRARLAWSVAAGWIPRPALYSLARPLARRVNVGPRPVLLVLAGLAVACLAAVGTLEPRGGRSRARLALASIAPPVHPTGTLQREHVPIFLALSGRSRGMSGSSHSRRIRSHARAVPPNRAAAAAAAPAVQEAQSSPMYSGGGGASASAARSSSTYAPTYASPASSATSTGGGGASPAPGPAGPGAAFGPGHLG